MKMNQRVKHNVMALAALKTDRSIPTLQGYSGWGGLREAIYTPSIYRQLQQVLDEPAINSLKQTLKSAYYTPPWLVSFLLQAVMRVSQGVVFEHILEPSAGHGAFLAGMQRLQGLRCWQSAHMTAVEIDSVSCEFLQALYPEATIVHSGFEAFHPATRYDLVVGNPPFGQVTVHDEQHPDLCPFSIHHYFVAKSLRLLKPHGLLAMLVPRYFLDASRKHVREIASREGASLLAAYRLPDHLFSEAKVTVDVILLRKAPGSVAWLHAKPYHGVNGERAWLNEYFFANPHHILGELVFYPIYGRQEITCQARGHLTQRLQQVLTALPITEQLNGLAMQIQSLQAQVAYLTQYQQQLLKPSD